LNSQVSKVCTSFIFLNFPGIGIVFFVINDMILDLVLVLKWIKCVWGGCFPIVI